MKNMHDSLNKILFLVGCCLLTFVGISQQMPEHFVENRVTNEIYRPIGITFTEDGTGYVWERNGVVHIIDADGQKLPEPLINLSEEVGNWGDHGSLGFALDPGFLNNGHFYLLYVVDRHHLLYYGTDMYSPDSTLANQATIGRLTRYTADPATGFTTTIPGSRKVLLGESIDAGMPILIASHGVGSLAFGTDGTLFASCGDGGSFLAFDVGSSADTYFQQALDDGIIRPDENVGSFRAHMTNSLCGKILRLDPETGDGVPSNPYYDSNNPRAPRSRVWSLGLRNPFRFIMRPETGSHNPSDGDPGTLYIGDVGANKWEELNIADKPGMNFGYPMFEGYLPKWGYWNADVAHPDAPNPLFGTNNCQQEFFLFKELTVQDAVSFDTAFLHPCDNSINIQTEVPLFVHSPPKVAFSNKLSNRPDRALVGIYNEAGALDTIQIDDPDSPIQGEHFSGYSSIAGCFYTGTAYPETYHGQYFHADYSWWIRSFDVDENNNFQNIKPFHTHADYVLSLAYNPKDECIYYIDHHSKLMKITYGGNAAPVAIAKVDQSYGPSPLPVQFSAEQSYDPEGTELTYFWDFGDGTNSDLINPTHLYTAPDNQPKPYWVTLSVTDSLGAIDSTGFYISLNNTPPNVRISSFEDGDQYPISGYTSLPLRAEVTDAEHGAAELSYSWEVFLQHNTHEHGEPIDTQRQTTALIEPIGCGDELYWHRIILTVTDAAGLSSRDTNNIFPYCGDPLAELDPWYVTVAEKTVDLHWSSSQEDDLDYYEIQRISSTNGILIIGQVAAKGSNSDYLFVDDSPWNGLNTYRLKMVRQDGLYDYSEERQAMFPPPAEFALFPNPISHSLNLAIRDTETPANFQLFDMSGRLVIDHSWQGEAQVLLPIAYLAAGTYTYRFVQGGLEKVGKVTKLP